MHSTDKMQSTLHSTKLPTTPKTVLEPDEPDWNRAEDRYRMITEAAYFRAEKRGFVMGFDEEDWFAAEQELRDRFAPD